MKLINDEVVVNRHLEGIFSPFKVMAAHDGIPGGVCDLGSTRVDSVHSLFPIPDRVFVFISFLESLHEATPHPFITTLEYIGFGVPLVE